MNFLKRAALLFLALPLLALSCCVGENFTPGISTADSRSKDGGEQSREISKPGAEWVEELVDSESPYKNRSFTIATVSHSLFFGGAETPLAKAVTLRNSLVEQRLGVEIKCEEKKADDVKKELRRAAKEGRPYADLICAPESVLAELAAEGLLENLCSLPYIDLSAPYADREVIDEQMALNTLYMLSGDLTLSVNSCVALFYNKKLLGERGADPEALVRSGGFTWEALTSMAQSVAEGRVKGIDSLLKDDELGYAVYGSAGKKTVSAGSGRQAESVYDAETARFAAGVVNGLFKNSKLSPQYGEKKVVDSFRKDEIGFVVATLDKVSLFDGSNSEWGLLPLPKRSAEQRGYCSPVSPGAMALAVPRGNSDSGFSGFVLNALLASSTDSLQEALKVTYRNYHFWSNDTALMLELISRTRQFDLGLCYSSVMAVADVGKNLLSKGQKKPPSAEAIADFDDFAASIFH